MPLQEYWQLRLICLRTFLADMHACLDGEESEVMHQSRCLQAKLDAAKVRLSKDAALVISGADVHIKSLDLDGALVVDAAPGARLVIDGLRVQNKGWKWQALNPNKPMTEEQMIRFACLPHHRSRPTLANQGYQHGGWMHERPVRDSRLLCDHRQA